MGLILAVLVPSVRNLEKREKLSGNLRTIRIWEGLYAWELFDDKTNSVDKGTGSP